MLKRRIVYVFFKIINLQDVRDVNNMESFMNSTIMSGFYQQFLTGDIYTLTGDSRETYSHL